MKKITTYLSFLVLMFFLVFLYSFTTGRNGRKTVQNAVVEFYEGDNNFLTHSMVNKLLIQNNESVQNKAKSVINLYGLENTVLQNPYVEEVAVFLTIDGQLKTTVKQRTPIARIIAGNSSYYIDKQGVNIPLSDNYSARVLLISGIENDENTKEILPLITLILDDNFLEKEIIGIEKMKNNEYQFSVRSGDYKIDFGKLTKIDVKFKKLKAFYNKTFVDKTIQNYKTITLKYV